MQQITAALLKAIEKGLISILFVLGKGRAADAQQMLYFTGYGIYAGKIQDLELSLCLEDPFNLFSYACSLFFPI